MANREESSLFARNLDLNRELKVGQFESILKSSFNEEASDIAVFSKKELVSYSLSLQEHIVELNGRLSTLKNDANIIASVNIGSHNSLAAIKAQLECQVEELAA